MNRIILTPALIVAAGLGLSACATPSAVTRDAPLGSLVPVIEAPAQDWSITRVDIVVPRTLTVSEANSIRPNADIVWREDRPGDRYAQVENILRAALTPVLQPRAGAATDVVVQIELVRFHALTERARYTVGGSHEVVFMLTVRHAATGEILSAPREVDLTFRAPGGQAAIQAEAQGITQRVAITERLQEWARVAFPASPGGGVVASAQN